MKLATLWVTIFLLSIFNLSFVFNAVLAQDNVFPGEPPSIAPGKTILGCKVGSGTDADTLPVCVGKIATTVLRYLMFFAIIIAALLLIWAGIEYIYKGGGEEGKGARTKIINAVVGLVIALVAWVVILAIQRTILQ